jgi:signal transduction histidine kinase
MKIKTQFNLLIAGIILVPVLSIVSQVLIWRLREREMPAGIPLYEDLAPYLESESVLKNMNSRRWSALRSFVARLRPNTDIVLLSKIDDVSTDEIPLRVIYSGINILTAGETVTHEHIYSLILSGHPRYGYTFESPPWLQGGRLFLLLREDRESPKYPGPMVFAFRALVFGCCMLFAFVLVMSIIIIRSITKSVLVLEDATRRIAAGELDLDIENLNEKTGKTPFLRRDNEITSLTFSLNSMRLALKEEEQSRSRFIMGVTHDLKTPLSLIKGYAEAIQDGITASPEARRNSLDIIVDKVDQLEGMIRDLINFVRLNTGEWQGHLEKTELRSFLSLFSVRLKDDAELLHRRLECDLNLPAELYIPMDEGLVSRALENLVNNSLRYTEENGLVRLKAYTKDDASIVIEVEDTGPGIPEENLPHIFEMFYRGDNSRRQQGLGLGLSVVKGVIDSHGWKISAVSPVFDREGAPGTCFTVTIPVIHNKIL